MTVLPIYSLMHTVVDYTQAMVSGFQFSTITGDRHDLTLALPQRTVPPVVSAATATLHTQPS